MAANAMPSQILSADRDRAEGTDGDEFSYCDMMLLGRTGLGKSTVGNKLLGINPETNRPYKDGTEIKQWGHHIDGKSYFETGDKIESVTKTCKVLSNDTVRVMDTMGFADSEMTERYGLMKGNLQGFRWILQAQRAHDLRFTRVIYFFPQRGPPDRVEGTLLQEIEVLYGYFGQKIFDIMVVVVTNSKKPYHQLAGFDEEDITKTRHVFTVAFEKVVKPKNGATSCPPVVYIPFNEDDEKVFELINGAAVISDADYLIFSPEYPKHSKLCGEQSDALFSLKYETSHKEKKKAFQKYRGTCFTFENRCTRCAIKLVYERQKSGEELPIAVIYPNGDQDAYDNSYCHPLFIPKSTQPVPISVWIWQMIKSIFTSPGADEECIKCKKPPGSDPCHPVNQWYEIIEGQIMKVDHSCEVDTVKLLEDADRKK